MAPKKPPPPDLSTLGARLRHARTLRGIGVRPLAEDVGLSGAAAHHIENDPTRDVKVSTVHAFAHRLDVHPAWLTFGTGPMEPYPAELPPPVLKRPAAK